MRISTRGSTLALATLLGAGLTFALPRLADAAVFTDVTDFADVSYLQHSNFCPVGVTLICEPDNMSGGAAVGDYDNDGWPDLFVTRLDDTDILFRNQGNGKFQDVTTAAGLAGFDLHSNGAGFADVDNDGDLDLYVTVLGVPNDPTNNRFYLFINDGNGAFTEEAVARGVALSGTDTHSGYSVAFGDYDRDGWIDMHVTSWLPITTLNHITYNRLFRNMGTAAPGHFQDVTVAAGVPMPTDPSCLGGTGPCAAFGFASTFSDLDMDGWPDLAVAADFGTSRLFWNNGNGTFTDGTASAGVATDENGMGSTIGDYDGDGDYDWFVTSIYDPDETCNTEPCNWGYTGNRLYQNNGNRTFTDATDAAGVREGYWGWGAAFFDYDNDRDLDLVMTNGANFINVPFDAAWNADPMRFWENDGTGVMTEVSTTVGVTDTGSGKGLLTFDYDKDGDLDLFVVNNYGTDFGTPVLYRNDGGNANDWLRVKTVGTTSNKDGIGVRVVVEETLGGPQQVREIGSTSHFLGQSERIAHFGLGSGAGTVALVYVYWPSNRLQTFFNVSPNQVLVATEPNGFARRCGLLGIEALAVPFLGLLARRRRARRRGR